MKVKYFAVRSISPIKPEYMMDEGAGKKPIANSDNLS
jgi:hypothetical protein